MSRKGGEFERECCKLLSLWLSGGKSDDHLWRSSGSGARATTRRKKGKKTAGHDSDIAGTTRLGLRLTKFISFELKNGYNRTSLYDLLDCKLPPMRPKSLKKQPSTTLGFIWQAINACEHAHTPHWAVIHRRKNRVAMIYGETKLFEALSCKPKNRSEFRLKILPPITTMQLKLFLKLANPKLLPRRK